MILTTEIVKEKVAEGDKFSTETQLIEKLGFPKAKGNTKKAQRKEIARYLTYEKTGKINPKTHKESNEIIITKIYESALSKVDKRTEKSSNYIDALKPCIQNLNGDFTVAELMEKIGLINDKAMFSSENLANLANKCPNQKTYLKFFKDSFKIKAISTMKNLEKNTLFFGSKMVYFLVKNSNQKYNKGEVKIADESETRQLEEIEKAEQQKIEEEKKIPFKNLRINDGIMKNYYDSINKRVQAEMGYDSCFKGFHIVGINEENNKADISEFKKLFKEYMQDQMEKYRYDINKKERNKSNDRRKAFGRGRDAYTLYPIEWSYPLKENLEVKKLHESIFKSL